MKLLKSGDQIGIVAPGSPVPMNIFKKGITVLENMGFNVMLGEHIFDVNEFTAGTALNRANDINNFFSEPKIKAIIAARGGYNCNQVIPYLDFDLIKKNPKFFFGLSDATVILNAISVKTRITTFHSPGVLMMGGGRDGQAFSKFSQDNFKKVIFDLDAKNNKISNAGSKWTVIKKGKTRGKLFGGNLNSIVGLVGTEYEPKWKNKIFFWECTGEKVENISQILTHLKLTKMFELISGMVIGKPTNITFGGNIYPDSKLCKMISGLLGDYNFPIIYGVDFGHTNNNVVLPIGGDISLDTNYNYIKIIRK